MKEIEIKTILIEYLISETDIAIGSEVPFLFGSRRADLITITGETATAYEIKSENDSINRLDYQIESYKSYFDFCYIVCEKNNLSAVRKKISKSIGILLADRHGIKKIRTSKNFKKLDKNALASTLNVKTLREITKDKNARSKYELCKLTSKRLNLQEIKKISRQNLSNRYIYSYQLLKNDISNKINSDDILTITRMPPNILVSKPKH